MYLFNVIFKIKILDGYMKKCWNFINLIVVLMIGIYVNIVFELFDN